MKISKTNATLAILVICVCSVAVVKYVMLDNRACQATSQDNPKALGLPRADVGIVEYLDFQCLACRRASSLIKEYFKKYPSRIFLEVKLFPLSSHRYGLVSAIYAECAAEQGKFWPYHYILFERQASWSSAKDVKGKFREFAREVNLDIQALDRCVTDPRTLSKIKAQKSQGTSVGVRSTPTFFINGKMIVGGRELTKELDKYFPHEKPAREEPSNDQ